MIYLKMPDGREWNVNRLISQIYYVSNGMIDSDKYEYYFAHKSQILDFANKNKKYKMVVSPVKFDDNWC